MIVAEHLRKTFPGKGKKAAPVIAVDDVSFTAHDGQITGLLGPNGAGKTTTMRMLYTLMQPEAGRVLVDGIDVGRDAEAVRRSLGVLPDARGVYKRLTARENIAYFGELHGMGAAQHDPRNVILDEPTNGLDVMTTRGLREFLKQLRAEGRCVIFSSHIMQEVAALCDRIVIIANGRVMAEGTPGELRAKAGIDNLEDAFVRLIGSDEGLHA